MAPKEKAEKIREVNDSEDEEPTRSKKSSKPKKTKKKKSSKSKGLLGGGDPVSGALSTVNDVGNGLLGGGGGQQQQQMQERPQAGGGAQTKDGTQPLSLRLDLNIDVEITLKARVHGDVTLALLA